MINLRVFQETTEQDIRNQDYFRKPRAYGHCCCPQPIYNLNHVDVEREKLKRILILEHVVSMVKNLYPQPIIFFSLSAICKPLKAQNSNVRGHQRGPTGQCLKLLIFATLWNEMKHKLS